MNLQPSFTAEKVAQLSRLSSTKQLDQIFEWVKTGHISRAVFRDLIAVVTSVNLETAARIMAEHQRQVDLDSPV